MRYLLFLLTLFIFSCDVPDAKIEGTSDVTVTLNCVNGIDYGEYTTLYYDYGTGYTPSVLYADDTLSVSFLCPSGINLNLWVEDLNGDTHHYDITVEYGGSEVYSENFSLWVGGTDGDYYKTIILP